MKRLDVKGWFKPKWKHNAEVKVKCVMQNEEINGLTTNHSPIPLLEQIQMQVLYTKGMESPSKIDLGMCHGGYPSNMHVNLGC